MHNSLELNLRIPREFRKSQNFFSTKPDDLLKAIAYGRQDPIKLVPNTG